MNFTIYTLGDLSSMTAMLNAVAMIFNDPIFNESGAIGGSAVRLVFLGVLAVVLLAGMTTMWRNGQGSPTIMLTVFVLWTTLGYTKATVTVVDIYSGSATTVDNVPLLVAVPGGVFTEVGQALGEKMQAAFSSADATAPALSTAGFINPLTYILSLRRVMASGMQPHVYNSLRYYAADCVLASDQAPSDIFESYRTLHELLDDDTFHDGFTSVFTNAFPRGTLASCLEASGYLKDNMTAWASVPFSTPANNMLKAGMGNNILRGASEMGKVAVLSSGGGLGASATVTPTSTDSSNVGQVLLDGLGRTSMSLASDVSAISASLAFLPGFSDGLMCGTPTPGITMADVNTCSLMSSDQDELARLIESARGGGFGRVAISSMGVFQAIWVALAPLMMLTILAHGSRGPKIFGAYLLLGLWVVSWLPVAYVVNYYIDLSFRQAVAQLGGSGTTFNLSQVYSLYRVAADKISVASDLMGAVPVLTMAILTGSVYAMTKVAGTTMPRPEGFNAHTGHMTTAASHQGLGSMAARFQQTGMTAASGEGFVKAGVQQDSVDFSAGAQHRMEHAARVAQGSEQGYARARESAMSAETGTRRTDSKGWDLASSYTKTLGKSRESSEAVGREILENLGFNEEAKDSAKAQATGSLAVQAGIGVLGNKAAAGMVGLIVKGRDLSVAEKKDLSERLSNSKAWKDTWKEGYEARGTLNDTQRQSLDKTTGLSETDRDAIQRSYKESRAAQESLQNAESFATNLGVGGKTNASTLAAGLTGGEVETFGRIADLAQNYHKDPERKRMLNAEFGGDSEAAQRFASQYGVLQNRAVSYGGREFIASSRNRAALAEMAFVQSGDSSGRFGALLEQSQRNQVFLATDRMRMPDENRLTVPMTPDVGGPKSITVDNVGSAVGSHLDPDKRRIAPLSPKPGVDAANRAADRSAAAGGIPMSDPRTGRERLDALAQSNEKRLKGLKVSGAQLTPEQIKDVGGSLTTQYSGMFDGIGGGWDDFATKHPAVAATAVAAFEVAPIAKGVQLLRGAKMAAAGGDAAYTAAKNVTKDQGIIADLTQRLAATSAKSGGIRTPEVMKLERDIANTAKNMAGNLKVLGGEGAKKSSILGAETTKEVNRAFNTLATLGAAHDVHKYGPKIMGSDKETPQGSAGSLQPASQKNVESQARDATPRAGTQAAERSYNRLDPAPIERPADSAALSKLDGSAAAPVVPAAPISAGVVARRVEGSELPRTAGSPGVVSPRVATVAVHEGNGRTELPASIVPREPQVNAQVAASPTVRSSQHTDLRTPVAPGATQARLPVAVVAGAQAIESAEGVEMDARGLPRANEKQAVAAVEPQRNRVEPPTIEIPPAVAHRAGAPESAPEAPPREGVEAPSREVTSQTKQSVASVEAAPIEPLNSDSAPLAAQSIAHAESKLVESPRERVESPKVDVPPPVAQPIARVEAAPIALPNERVEPPKVDVPPPASQGGVGGAETVAVEPWRGRIDPSKGEVQPPVTQNAARAEVAQVVATRSAEQAEGLRPIVPPVTQAIPVSPVGPVQEIQRAELRTQDENFAGPVSGDTMARIEQVAMTVESAALRADNAASHAVAAADRAAAASSRTNRGGAAPAKSEANALTPVASNSTAGMLRVMKEREAKRKG